MGTIYHGDVRADLERLHMDLYTDAERAQIMKHRRAAQQAARESVQRLNPPLRRQVRDLKDVPSLSEVVVKHFAAEKDNGF